jgi:hypothetical protein
MSVKASRERVEQRPGLPKVLGVETFGEPPVHGREQVTCGCGLAPGMPEPRQSCGGAEFPGPRGLGAGDLHSFPVVVLRLGRRLAAHGQQGVAPGDEQRALEVALACPAGNGERLVGDGDRLVPAAVADEGLRK